MFRSASLFIGTSFTVAVFAIFATSNVYSIVGIPHKIYSMQKILIHIKSRSLCWMCPSAPRVCSEPGGQKPVLSLSLDLIDNKSVLVQVMTWCRTGSKPLPEPMLTWFTDTYICCIRGRWVKLQSQASGNYGKIIKLCKIVSKYLNSLWPSDAIWCWRT